VLSARAVSRSYGRRVALAPLDLDLHPGELVALVGPNGAGKSTLLSVMAGAIPPSSGQVVAGEPPPRIGWVPQRPAQYSHLSALENLELFARLSRLEHPAETAEAVRARTGLPGTRQPASQLSVGNQQRLNVAIGLLGDPDVLLLDEPTASLDPAHRRSLLDAVAGLRDRGCSILYATHFLEEVERLAERVVVLSEGKAVLTGTPSEAQAALPELTL
jgi:ABC-type multidrug transport system ATPase subunit